MLKSGGHKSACARRTLRALLLLSAIAALSPLNERCEVSTAAGHGAAGAHARRPRQQDERVDIRLRSFAPGASGQLTIEPTTEGGRARLTATGLPEPQTQGRDARAYVVWANADGRIIRLGELTRDARGNGGLAFSHPAGFERYTVLVTAESSATATRPFGAPVLSTRGGEAAPLYPTLPPTEPVMPSPTTTNAGTTTTAGAPRSFRVAPAGRGFYGEVEDALAARGGGRSLELEGAEHAPGARGRARATAAAGNAYLVVRFNDVPLPRTSDAGVYLMWAIQPDGRILYMGSLPADETLNLTDIYVRVPGFSSDAYDLFVTAERQRPAAYPSDRRALSTRNALNTLK